jgi:hypothetical protein
METCMRLLFVCKENMYKYDTQLDDNQKQFKTQSTMYYIRFWLWAKREWECTTLNEYNTMWCSFTVVYNSISYFTLHYQKLWSCETCACNFPMQPDETNTIMQRDVWKKLSFISRSRSPFFFVENEFSTSIAWPEERTSRAMNKRREEEESMNKNLNNGNGNEISQFIL